MDTKEAKRQLLSDKVNVEYKTDETPGLELRNSNGIVTARIPVWAFKNMSVGEAAQFIGESLIAHMPSLTALYLPHPEGDRRPANDLIRRAREDLLRWERLRAGNPNNTDKAESAEAAFIRCLGEELSEEEKRQCVALWASEPELPK